MAEKLDEMVPPPSYDKVTKSTPVWNVNPQPATYGLAWHRSQRHVVGHFKSEATPAVPGQTDDLEVILNDNQGKHCNVDVAALRALLEEQVPKSPRARIRIRGTHHGSGKKKLGTNVDFDIFINADWLVGFEDNSTQKSPTVQVASNVIAQAGESAQSLAEWMLEDYATAKVILIERQASALSERLKSQMVETVRKTNYRGSLNISVEVDNDVLIITRQEITSRTTIRNDLKRHPASFSILPPFSVKDKRVNRLKIELAKLKESMEEDMCSIKVSWPSNDASADADVADDQPVREARGMAKVEEAWLSAWEIPIQNAIIEWKEDSKNAVRTLTSTDQNDATELGLRRRWPKKTWGSSWFSVTR